MFADFFNTFIKPVINIVQNVVKLAQNMSQAVSDHAGASPQQPVSTSATQSTSTAVTTITSEERERLRRQQTEATRQRKLARMEAEFEQSTASTHAVVDDADQSTTIPTDYTSTPADADIQYLGNPEIDKLTRLLAGGAALFATAVAVTGSLKGAVDLLLAQGIKLSAEALAQAVASVQIADNNTQDSIAYSMIPQNECQGTSQQECDVYCWEKWRGENSDIAQQGMDICYQNCMNNRLEELAAIQQELAAAQARCNVLKEYAEGLVVYGKLEGRAVLSRTIQYANSVFNYTNSRELSDDISCAITGARGPNTILGASPIGAGFGYPRQEIQLGLGGWHSDYNDNTNNQAFHFWSYVNTVAQGSDPSSVEATLANTFHECWDITDTGRTTEDANLAVAGIILGHAINTDRYSPGEISDWIDTWLENKSFQDLVNSPDGQEAGLNMSTPRICPLINTTWTIQKIINGQ